MEMKENVRSLASYAPCPQRAEFLVDYGFAKSGHAQMVDARIFQEFGESRIPNTTFISHENVLEMRFMVLLWCVLFCISWIQYQDLHITGLILEEKV